MNRLTALTAELPVLWARCYTAGLPGPMRDRRVAEIQSDAFEHANDPILGERPFRRTWDVLQSFLRGLPDDLRWRAANTPAGMWIAEVACLSATLSLLGASFALVQTTESTDMPDRIAVGLGGFTFGLVVGIWCAVSLRSAASTPLFPAPKTRHSPVPADPRGDSMELHAFARWSGYFLIAAGIFQAISFAAGAAGGYDYFAGTATLLNTIADEQALFVVAITAGALTTPLLLPLFIYLLLMSERGQRPKMATATALLGIYLALTVVGMALFAVLLPIANDFTGASGATAETLESQARGFLQLRLILIQPAGVAMVIALTLAVLQMRRTAFAPTWLNVVGVALALSWLPPIAGNFIITYPLFVIWTVASGWLLVRREAGGAVAAPLPA